MPTQTRTQAAQALSLGTARRSPGEVNNFRGFSARKSTTPIPNQPLAPTNDLEDEPDLDKPDDFNPSGNDPSDDGPGDDRPGDDLDNDDDEPLPEGDVEPGVTMLDNLAKAIELLACNAHTGSESSSRTKLFIPERDGSQVVQTGLTGTEDPEDQPYWMDSWKKFVIELQTTFGPHNLVADTESQLDHLQMKDNHWVNKYMVEFNWLASQVWGYGDGALCHFFYTGLPDHIKDEEIDACYWERKEEVQRSSKHQGLSSGSKSTPNPGHNNQPKSSQEKSKTSNNSGNGNSGNQPPSKPASTSHTGSNTPKPDSNKLGKDSKLTLEECKHHRDNNLCMFCGGTGHFADKCPKKARKAKAHTAATSEAAPAPTSGSAPEAKK
ncbi:hypothetical protein M404DRAFT_21763 [Pisolithus tinctorius Marx 270]|uniref:CCHC-type domain-containing protein n=1 Tax=Pisolithus tinctorius Marx 270 TaxID=870435 RepID=A0A0C3PMP9_PISTI|nr:hypothetical protein M404DRAFT_21763 [Pisolithus tinctorius Marx 270]